MFGPSSRSCLTRIQSRAPLCTSVPSKKAFRIMCYDAYGDWEKDYLIDYVELFRVTWGDRYSRHFNAYMRDRDDVPTPTPHQHGIE